MSDKPSQFDECFPEHLAKRKAEFREARSTMTDTPTSMRERLMQVVANAVDCSAKCRAYPETCYCARQSIDAIFREYVVIPIEGKTTEAEIPGEDSHE